MILTQWHNIRFEVIGKVQGKARPRFSRNGGKFKTYTPTKTKDYEELIKLTYRTVSNYKSDKALRMKILVYHQPAKSTTKKLLKALFEKKYLCTIKPDIDNIAKVVLDALNGVAYNDDIQICQLAVIKEFAQTEKIVVYIDEIGECKPKK